MDEVVLRAMESLKNEANEHAEMFGLTPADAAVYALFAAIKQAPVPLGLKGLPFVLRHNEIQKALGQETQWPGFFSMVDLEKALDDDFLDAARGSTDNRKGWQVRKDSCSCLMLLNTMIKLEIHCHLLDSLQFLACPQITDVSQPRGESFEEARMTFQDVQAALEKGTVIFNAAGAHIPKLAAPSLACTDATLLPCALNLYVTAKEKRTSAPPHTDKQDVVVVQTSGRKYWKVYSPPDPAMKPWADSFARGKMDDSLPLYALESDFGCELLVETTLNPGDAMFVPAAFPHTTSTVVDDDNPEAQETSIHLTLGIDHHIWELDYLSTRRLALRRAHVHDNALGQMRDEDNRYVGRANELPLDVRSDLFAELPLGLLDEDDKAKPILDEMASELERISRAVDDETASAVDESVWRETAERVRQQGVELLNIHRDMYMAAIEEGRTREAEEAMTAHLDKSVRRTMTPERIQRLSLFRVKRYFDEIDKSKKALLEWSYAGEKPSNGDGTYQGSLSDNWAFTLPVKVGDQVEADLGGAFFPATVCRASGEMYDVTFFDGDQETGLDRSQIKLLSPPAPTDDVDTSKMTKKELKRSKKKQEKLKRKTS